MTTILDKAAPPAHKPTLERSFAADPFDPRMHKNNAGRDMTPLGLLLSIWNWGKFAPGSIPLVVMNSIDALLRRECPKDIEELERLYAKI